MADRVSLLAVGLSLGLLALLLLALLWFCRWRRKKKDQSLYEELPSPVPSVPSGSAPVIQVSQCSWTTPSEIPFTLPPRFTTQTRGEVKTEEEEEVEMKMETQRDI
ncbi:unnamed protein product [Pleuronectes platessa]|uniref:Uncharacterized protein n=1 Tax=Pleuronectes platessa TaxID=8262 RepID=A0A9N7YBA2_PLEPL|nr:unnamed protein product [Pleuronectes platessa]